MTKQKLKTMKHVRSMTAAAVSHSLIICWFLSLWWRSWSSLCSLLSIMSLTEANRRSAGLMLCPAAAAAAADDAIDVWSFVSRKSRMPHSTPDVDRIPFSSFGPTHSTLLTSWFSTGSQLSSWRVCSLWPFWPSSFCGWPTGPTRSPMTSLRVTSPRGTVFSLKTFARWPQM